MNGDIPSRRQALTCFALLGMAVLAVYGRSLQNGFVEWDDGLLIVENPIVWEISLATIRAAFTTYDPELYIPLTLLSYQVDHMLGGLRPFVYHFTNLLLHAFNASLVLWFTLLLSRRRWVAGVAALLFAVHPMNTEAVAWASARKDVLSAFFTLLTLVSYLMYAKGGSRRWYAGSIAALLLALLSKASAVTAPLILLLLDWRAQGKITRSNLLEKAPHMLLAALFGVIALGGKAGNEALLWEKLLIGCKAAFFYLQKLAVPGGYSVLYPYTKAISLGNPDLLYSLLALLALAVLALYAAKRTREPLFALGLFLLAVFPSFSNIAKGQDLLRDVYFASDRYAYLPGIAFFYLLALFLAEAVRRRPQPAQAAIAAAAVFLAFQAHVQSLVWRDTGALFENVLTHYPESHLAHNNLGSLAFRRGEYDAAFAHYRESLQIRPNGEAYYNLGQFFTEMQRFPEAEEAYRQALAQRPGDAAALVNLGVLELRRGALSEAEEHLTQALALDSSLPAIYYNLGLVYERQGRVEEAATAYRRVLELNPEDAEVREMLERLEL